MIRRYFLWSLALIILIYIIKNAIELFTATDTHKQDDTINPEDLIPDTMFCPKCNQSYKDDIKECTECKVPTISFEENIDTQNNNDTDSPDPDKTFIKIFMADSEIQSRMIQMKLNEVDIESILDSNTSASILAFGDESIDAITILVPVENSDQAREIIQDYLNTPDSENPAR